MNHLEEQASEVEALDSIYCGEMESKSIFYEILVFNCYEAYNFVEINSQDKQIGFYFD